MHVDQSRLFIQLQIILKNFNLIVFYLANFFFRKSVFFSSSFSAHKPLAQFLETTKLMTPEQRAEHLKHAMDMATANDAIAEEGESRVGFINHFFLFLWC
jgi:hypothetical protein